MENLKNDNKLNNLNENTLQNANQNNDKIKGRSLTEPVAENNPFTSSNVKRRVFSESEQNNGTYNVGMKRKNNRENKNKNNGELTPNDMKNLVKSVNENLDKVNPDLHLESMEQGELLSKTGIGSTLKKHKKRS